MSCRPPHYTNFRLWLNKTIMVVNTFKNIFFYVRKRTLGGAFGRQANQNAVLTTVCLSSVIIIIYVKLYKVLGEKQISRLIASSDTMIKRSSKHGNKKLDFSGFDELHAAFPQAHLEGFVDIPAFTPYPLPRKAVIYHITSSWYFSSAVGLNASVEGIGER